MKDDDRASEMSLGRSGDACGPELAVGDPALADTNLGRVFRVASKRVFQELLDYQYIRSQKTIVNMSLPPSSQIAAPIPSSQMVGTPEPTKKLKKYRPVKPLPFELRDIINVYIEEKLCTVFALNPLHRTSLI